MCIHLYMHAIILNKQTSKQENDHQMKMQYIYIYIDAKKKKIIFFFDKILKLNCRRWYDQPLDAIMILI